MKLLHTADWHLGKRLDKFSRIEEQQVDAVLVSGDLYCTRSQVGVGNAIA